MWDVIIIGAGAAGLWAAGTAAARQRRVLVLEKNRKAGVKILMSGGTRCNITHACDSVGMIDAFGVQGRFLKPALHALTPDDVVAEFARLGVATKREPNGKIFPCSDRAIDVRDALVARLESSGAQLRTGVSVMDVAQQADGTWRVRVEDAELSTEKVILATGGLSYPGCGTTGDGYAWARAAGHAIEPTFPALAPLLSPAQWVHELQGLTMPDVAVSVSAVHGDRRRDPRLTNRNSLLWTHFGCSGPAAMNVSKGFSMMDRPHDAQLVIDLLPDLDINECTKALQSGAASGNGRKLISTCLQPWVPRRMAETVMQIASVSESTTIAELTKEGRRKMVANLKSLQVPINGTRGYSKAEVTAGGVRRDEIEPRTMRSRKADGLYLIGEILDVDGPIGGFNFQAAFSTGHVAGLDA